MIKLKSIKGKSIKRPGRGISAGGGKTAGRGTKGQKSRAGHNIPNRFEGGQTVLSMRLPKLPGFKSKGKKAIVITLDDISRNFKDGEVVSKEKLIEKKMINKLDVAKVLNTGKLTVKVTLDPTVKASKSVESLFTDSHVMEEKSEKSSRATTRDPEKSEVSSHSVSPVSSRASVSEPRDLKIETSPDVNAPKGTPQVKKITKTTKE